MADEGRATEGDGRESPAEDQGQDGDSDKQTTTPTIDNQSDSNISYYQHQPDWIEKILKIFYNHVFSCSRVNG